MLSTDASKDSGRGDSDSNPETLTDWCQPECLTLGHSDSCWLPNTGVRNRDSTEI